jgi:hypothetical protein
VSLEQPPDDGMKTVRSPPILLWTKSGERPSRSRNKSNEQANGDGQTRALEHRIGIRPFPEPLSVNLAPSPRNEP